MKLKTAIHAADKVFIQASFTGVPIRFRVSKAEVYRVVDAYYLDADLNEEDVWSDDEGLSPLWIKNDLILSFT